MPDLNDPSWSEVLFKNLQLSIVQLLAGTIGAGISIPITQEHWGWFRDARGNAADAVGLGVYTLLISITGTWLFLGLFGRRAREAGGRWLQFAVQVVGIAITAWMTLPSAIVVTLTAMALIGNEVEDRKKIDENKK